MAVPTIYAKLMQAHAAADAGARARWAAAARGLRLCTSGSASLPASLLEAFRDATGQTILERYGMTGDWHGAVEPVRRPARPRRRRPRAAGRLGRHRRRGGPRRPAVGEPGELRVRTPQMFSAYHGDAAATAASFDEEGRFRTGDTGTRDADGVVRLLGRTSIDIIKSGGYKLSALEIEAVLLEHPAVAEVAVTGVPDATWGERVTAWVVARGPPGRRRWPTCRRSRASGSPRTSCRARWSWLRNCRATPWVRYRSSVCARVSAMMRRRR